MNGPRSISLPGRRKEGNQLWRVSFVTNSLGGDRGWGKSSWGEENHASVAKGVPFQSAGFLRSP